MNTFKRLIAVGLLGIASAASAQIDIVDPSAPGMSMDTAVRLVAPSDLMLDRYIERWLRTHYPGWTAEPYEMREFGSERFAVVYITSEKKSPRRVYFRIVSSPAEPDDRSPFPL